MKVLKFLFVVIPLLVMFVSIVDAAEYSLDINRLNYYYDDDPTWNASTIYYPKSDSTFRNYRRYNIQLWGWTPETLHPVPTNVDPNTEPDLYVDDYQIHLFDQFTTSQQVEFPVTTYGGIVNNSGLGMVVSTEQVAGEFVYYQDSTGEGNPNNKWPYTRPEYVYNTRSFEVYDVQSNTDAFIASTVGGTKPAIWVSTPAAITALTDYLLVYNGTGYDVYAVTNWTNDGTRWVANHGSSTVATLTPGVDNTFNGITIGITAGSTGYEAQVGDTFLLRAHGVVSEQDSIIVLQDNTHYLSEIENMNLAVINRTYAYTVSYLDATIIQDMELVNTHNTTYTNFFYGYVSNDQACGWGSDVIRYYPAKNAFFKYDYNGRKDVAPTNEQSSTALQGDWHNGEYGTLPYAIYMIKIMQPLAVDGYPQTARFTLEQGMGTQNAAIDMYFGSDYQDLSYPDKEITTFADIPAGAQATWMFTTSPNFMGIKLETTAANIDTTGTGSPAGTWWETSIRGTQMYGTVTNGIKATVWNPNTLDNTTNYWWASLNVKGYGQVYSMGWVLPELPANAHARMVFANSFAENRTDGWVNGRNPEPTTDLGMRKLWTLADSLDELYASGMAPAFVPVEPLITKKIGYSENTQTNDANNNTQYQVEWALNAETHPMNAFGPTFRTQYYELTEFNGREFRPILRFTAALHTSFGLVAKLATDATAIATLEHPTLPPDIIDNLYQGGQWFNREENDPDILWFTAALLNAIIPLNEDGQVIRDTNQNFRIGLRFEEGTTSFTIDNVIGYVFENRMKSFGYAYRVTLQAINGGLLASSISGDNNFEIIPAAKMNTSGVNHVTVVPNPLMIGTNWDKTEQTSEIKFNHIPPVCTIKIFDVTGNMIRQIEHTDGNTQQKWDLLTQYNQEVAPGLYIYVIIDNAGNKSKGTFSIVR